MHRLGVIVALVVATPVTAAPPLEAYGRLPTIALVVLSPDGNQVALVFGDETERQIQVRVATSGHDLVYAMRIGAAKVRALRWAGNDHLVVERSATAQIAGLTGEKHEYGLAFDIDLAKRRLRPLLNDDVEGSPRKLNTIQAIVSAGMIDGKPVAYLTGVTFPGSEGLLTLFRVDLASGLTQQVAVGGTATRGWVVDPAGTVAARVDYFQQNGQWSLWTRSGGHLVKSLSEVHPLDAPGLAGFGRTADTLLIARHDDEDIVYEELRLGDDHVSPPVAELAGGSPVTDPRTGQAIGSERANGLVIDYRFLDPADAKMWQSVRRAFPDAVVRLESWSDDRRKLVLRVEGKDFGAGYFLLDLATHRADMLGDEYRQIGPADLAEQMAITYPAADGLAIPAFLTLPPGRKPKRLPLVVLPHGGPGAHDAAGFDWWAQALASRGYAVLQPQFRGSTGRGSAFLRAGYGEWGRKMQTDLSDGVRFLATAGTIDPARVCIVGASYGGYAALAGATLQSKVYRCAVSIAGPSDLRAMLSWEQEMTGGSKNFTLRHWQRFMGAKSPDDRVLDTISPAKFAAQVTVPILLIHGVDDTIVPITQSRTMAAALTRANKPVEFVTLKGEDHWLSRSETRLQMLGATTAFLATNLPPDDPATTR